MAGEVGESLVEAKKRVAVDLAVCNDILSIQDGKVIASLNCLSTFTGILRFASFTYIFTTKSSIPPARTRYESSPS